MMMLTHSNTMRGVDPASKVIVGEGDCAEGVDVWENGCFEVVVMC